MVNEEADSEIRTGELGPDFGHLKILKGVQRPRGRGSFYWDHLIVFLERGDAFRMVQKEAYAFAARARKVGYVVVLARAIDSPGETDVWFGGKRQLV